MTREQFANNASTTLSFSCTSGATSISVADGSVFPATGDFRLLIDAEIMLCTARSGDTLTVVRAQEGTSAAAHSSAAAVTHIVTAGALGQFMADNVPSYGRPPFRLLDASGNVLTSADFTTVNLSTSTISDQDDSICLRMAAGGAAVNLTVLARPASSPGSLVVALQPTILAGDSSQTPQALAGVRESSSGKMMTIGWFTYAGFSGVAVQRDTSETSFNSAAFAKQNYLFAGPAVWLKVADDGTNLTFYVGDGIEWVAVASESRTAFMSGGPDQFIWGMNAGSCTLDVLNRLVAWQEG